MMISYVDGFDAVFAFRCRAAGYGRGGKPAPAERNGLSAQIQACMAKCAVIQGPMTLRSARLMLEAVLVGQASAT